MHEDLQEPVESSSHGKLLPTAGGAAAATSTWEQSREQPHGTDLGADLGTATFPSSKSKWDSGHSRSRDTHTRAQDVLVLMVALLGDTSEDIEDRRTRL